jgi:hypothetical protein
MGLAEIIIIALTVLGLVGVVLAIIGWGGRRIGDHPHCVACGFDLYGLQKPERCPECGELLRGPDRIVTGEFRRRWILFSIGLLLLAPGVSLLATDVIARAQGTPWIQREPAWLLIRTMQPRDPQNPGDELAELNRRVTSGAYSNEYVADVAREMIRLQQTSDAEWHPMMGRIVEQVRAAGALSDEDWAHYLFDFTTPRMNVRALTHTGDPIAGEIFKDGWRLGDTNFPLTATVESVQLDDAAVPAPPAILTSVRGFNIPLFIEKPLAPGAHELTVRVSLRDASVKADAPTAFARSYVLTKTFRVTDDAPTLPPHHESELVERYRKGLTPKIYDAAQRQTVPGVRRDGANSVNLEFSLNRVHPHAIHYGVAYDVLLEINGTQRVVGGFAFAANTSFGYGFTARNVPAEATQLRVILRPSRDRALRHVGITDWVDAEFVYDVPIYPSAANN